MSRNISQSTLGSRLNFNHNFPDNFSMINSSRVTSDQTKSVSRPTQFPILPNHDWICTKCSNNNAKGSYVCKKCGQLIDSTMASFRNEYSTVEQPLNAGSSTLRIGSVVHTPFGLLQTFAIPDPKNFNFDASKGYYYDSTTGFFYDKNSYYYYNPKSNKWMFWCSKFNTYIDCAGGDLDLKRSLQEEEYDLQKGRTSEKPDDRVSDTPGSLVVQRRSDNIADDWIDLIKRVGGGSVLTSGKATHDSNIKNPSSTIQSEKTRNTGISEREMKNLKGTINSNAQTNLRDSILQNEKLLVDLYKLLAQETDPRAIEKIQSQIDGFISTTRSLKDLLSILSRSDNSDGSESASKQKPISSSIITPQFKRHITKSIQNVDNFNHRTIEENTFVGQNPGLTASLRRDVGLGQQKDFKRPSERSNISLRDAILEGKRTAFDEHIEQVERLRNSIGNAKSGLKQNWSTSKSNTQIVPPKENSLEEQIRTMVDEQVEKQWMLSSSSDTNSKTYDRQNRSPHRRKSRRDRSRSRHRSRSRVNRRSRKSSPVRSQRSRSKSVRRSARSRSRSRYNDKDDDDIEIISQGFIENSGYLQRNRAYSRSPQAPPILPMALSPPPSKSVRGNGDVPSEIQEVLFSRSNCMSDQRRMGEPLLHDQVNYANMQNSSFFSGSNSRQGMSSFSGNFSMPPPPGTQVRPIVHQSGFATKPGVSPIVEQNKFITSNSKQWKIPTFHPSVQNLLVICDYCGRDGHSLETCPTLPTKIYSQDRFIRNELESINSTNNITDKNVPAGLCLNCGRYGHSQIGCLLPRITDNELQKKIRKAEDKQRLQQLDKLKMKRKAENYIVRRNDPFILRLRSIAPHGKITKEHVRIVCQRCSGLGHVSHECARAEVPRSILKQINEKLEEFTKVFFVHLNDDNLVDFSKKFQMFVVMDGIEKSGTVDPVGLQLQTQCNRGIVTRGDLRHLCSNCASLGHVPADCKQKTACSKQHYEKMLELVNAYRALVKEGNGNFFLPRLEQYHNQQSPNISNDNNINNSSIKHSVTKTPDILFVDSDDDGSSRKRRNDRKK